MELIEARAIASDAERLAGLIGVPYSKWAGKCHQIALAILRTGEFGPGRIARGRAPGVRSQHSWIVLGDDVYDGQAIIVDPTITPSMAREHGGDSPLLADADPIVVSMAHRLPHRPHGAGSIWAYGRPENARGAVIELTPAQPLSGLAQSFLDMLGPLDIRGWGFLAHCPVRDWPAGEIIAAMDDTPELKALVPIDILGMVTDRNPGGLYR